MSVLKVERLCKAYSTFALENVSFALEGGKITGFIGRNGAGKTTTLKSLLNFIHPDSGTITFFDKDFKTHEFDIKQDIGFVSGGVNYYPTKKLKAITEVTKPFYKTWDEAAYKKYMQLFKLEEDKTPAQLSEGMKVKYALTLALSHQAKLLILDEPTSGLDPVSRDDLLDVFLELCDKGITILFSTHITSDLDKCADNIVYIKNGKILAESDMKTFLMRYRVVELEEGQLTDQVKRKLIGYKRSKVGYSALVEVEQIEGVPGKISEADLEAVMVHLEKEEE